MALSLVKRIDDFYKFGKQFPALSLFCFIPAIGIMAMPLGWYFALQRKQLLAETPPATTGLDAQDPVAENLAPHEKLTAIRGWTLRFFVPTVIVLVEAVIGAVMYRYGVFDGLAAAMQ